MKKAKPGLLELRPTQFVLGMKEVEAKLKKFASFSKSQRLKYCKNHAIPIVWGWDQQPYMIDHHHFARACWESDVDDYEVVVFEDFRHLGKAAFWRQMRKLKLTYLRDQFGYGPHSPDSLPIDIRCLADDPYRSLAWAVIDAGVVKKDVLPFFEFQWAEFFRAHLKTELHGKSDFQNAIELSIKLARSQKARALPGFLGTEKIGK